MDHEAALISKVLTEGCIEAVIDARVSGDLFVAHKAVWEYVLEVYRKHGGVPPKDNVENRFQNFEVTVSDTPWTFYAEELRKRWIHNTLAQSMKTQAAYLKSRDPLAALEEMRHAILKAEIEARPSRDVNIVVEPEKRVKAYEEIVAAGGVTGLPTPWACFNEVSQGFHAEDLIMIAGRGGVGKCICEGTPVYCPDTGRYLPVEEVIEKKSRVLTRHSDGSVSAVTPDAWLDMGTKDCLWVKFESGREMIQTPEHPMMTVDGWKRTDELEVGRFVEVIHKVPEPENPVVPDKNEMESIISAYLSLDERFWSFPDYIFSYDNENVRKFLGIFWSRYGSVRSSKQYLQVELRTCSRELAFQLQQLLLRFAIHSRVYHQKKWVIRILPAYRYLFKITIPISGELASKISQVEEASATNIDTIPTVQDIRKEVFRISERFDMEEKRRRVKRMSEMLGATSSFSLTRLYRCSSSSRKTLSAFIEVFEVEQWKWMLENRWDKITSIQPVGERRVFDLTVPKTHSFIANDYVVHNTFAETVIGCHLWSLGYTPLMFSREMAVSQIVRRLDAIHCQLPYQRFRSGLLTSQEFERWKQSLKDMEDGIPFWVSGDDEGRLGVSGIAAKIHRYHPHIVLIDGGYLLEDERGAKAAWERWSNVCRDLKRLSQREQLPILLTHQFNLAGKDGKGDADTLKYGDVQMWFDLIIGMYQHENLRENKEMLFKINKQREGEILSWITRWDLEAMQFEVLSHGVEGPEGQVPYDEAPDSDVAKENAVRY